MIPRLAACTLAIAVATGCVVHTHDYHEEPGETIYVEPGPVVNFSPMVLSADAGVFWDDYYFDDIWYFSADVDDPDGVYDVVEVWADVYDEYRGGVLVESFPLDPTADPYIWYSEWLGSSTYLDPFYDGYTVDIVAYDSFDDFGWTTIWANSY
jgi:hypothetical protein